MNKARKRFVLFAETAVIVLLMVLLTVINVVNFAMATEDADIITGNIAAANGYLEGDKALREGDDAVPPDNGTNTPPDNDTDISPQQPDQVNASIPEPPAMVSNDNSGRTVPMAESDNDTSQGNADNGNAAKRPPVGRKNWGGFGSMGVNSPDIFSSVRYFTFSFDKKGNAEQVAFKISAVDESEAQQWAEKLLDAAPTGWTNLTYRYRVYSVKGKTYVTVIDQGRELLPSYRILIISVCGGLVLIILSWLCLILAGRRLFMPLEESDRKQKQFIANIESDFKVPLTVISANTELMDKENGPSEYTGAINKQVRKMTAVVKELSELSVFDDSDLAVSKVNLSDLLSIAIDKQRSSMEARGIALETDIAPDIMIKGDEGVLKRAFAEMAENTVKFADTKGGFQLRKTDSRIIIRQTNDTALPGGSIDQIFDRFTTLENAAGKQGVGLGLSYVKDAVKAHNGRVSARVNDGIFTLQIDL